MPSNYCTKMLLSTTFEIGINDSKLATLIGWNKTRLQKKTSETYGDSLKRNQINIDFVTRRV